MGWHVASLFSGEASIPVSDFVLIPRNSAGTNTMPVE